ncbi:hypothetical protein DFH06DRAFT_1327338 [Mycena polygramma]|nr:hypothetical protein DFH06DRAFT_1327338 [Mycena polygramma]
MRRESSVRSKGMKGKNPGTERQGSWCEVLSCSDAPLRQLQWACQICAGENSYRGTEPCSAVSHGQRPRATCRLVSYALDIQILLTLPLEPNKLDAIDLTEFNSVQPAISSFTDMPFEPMYEDTSERVGIQQLWPRHSHVCVRGNVPIYSPGVAVLCSIGPSCFLDFPYEPAASADTLFDNPQASGSFESGFDFNFDASVLTPDALSVPSTVGLGDEWGSGTSAVDCSTLAPWTCATLLALNGELENSSCLRARYDPQSSNPLDNTSHDTTPLPRTQTVAARDVFHHV